jgi:hypothetical protein
MINNKRTSIFERRAELFIGMIAGSGYVYRADWATGNEGSNLTVVFEYPW